MHAPAQADPAVSLPEVIAPAEAVKTVPQPLAVRVLVGVEQAVSAALVAALFVLVILQVGSRYLFGNPLVWSEELARFALIWMTFVGAGFVMAYRRHIIVSIFKVGDRTWLALETVSSAVILVVTLMILPAGVAFVQSNTGVSSAAAGVPLGWVKSSALVGFGLVAVHVLLNLYVAFRYGRVAVEGGAVFDQRAAA